MEVKRKCSNKKHSGTNALSYCFECNLYLCNKCTNNHIEFLETHHINYLNKNNEEIFTGLCKEYGHKMKLEYFCYDHNILCCAACLCTIKDNTNGQHSKCNVSSIKEIKEEKKERLIKNIKSLEDLSINIEDSIKKLKELYKLINENKEETKLKISRIFTKIRNEVNKREDELLLKLDNICENKFFKEDLIKKAEKLPKQIKILLDKVKIMKEEWNDDNKLIERINYCVDLENKINNIFEIKENIEKCELNEPKILFSPEKEDNFIFLEQIKFFGKIYIENFMLDEEAIKTVIEEGKCSRKEAIRALKVHNGDPVEALLEIGSHYLIK